MTGHFCKMTSHFGHFLGHNDQIISLVILVIFWVTMSSHFGNLLSWPDNFPQKQVIDWLSQEDKTTFLQQFSYLNLEQQQQPTTSSSQLQSTWCSLPSSSSCPWTQQFWSSSCVSCVWDIGMGRGCKQILIINIGHVFLFKLKGASSCSSNQQI